MRLSHYRYRVMRAILVEERRRDARLTATEGPQA